jgi:hypothetical protein
VAVTLEDFVRAELAKDPKASAAELRARYVDAGHDARELPKAAFKRVRDAVSAEAGASSEAEPDDETPTLARLTSRLAAEVVGGGKASEIKALVEAVAKLAAITPKGPASAESEDWARLSSVEAVVLATLARKLHGAPLDAEGLWIVGALALWPLAALEAHPAHTPLPDEPRPAKTVVGGSTT